jgi:hypothetical protein
MRKRVCTAAALAVATLSFTVVLLASPASAAPVLGGQLFGTGGEVTVEVLAPTATFTSELRLCSPGSGQFIALNHDVGTVVNLGTFPAGTELVFCIFVRDTGQTFYMGPGDRNPDGIPHAVVDVTAPGEATVGFEDLLGGGDRDYDDNNFRFTGVIPNPPPDCSGVTASPTSLWPPNHKMQLVTLSGATDPDGGPVTTTITGVTQDEAVNGTGDGDTAPDAAAGPGSDKVYLRAERAGGGDGRVYHIAFTVTDGEGGSCQGVVTVGVPHDQGPNGGPVDSGSAIDSFGS